MSEKWHVWKQNPNKDTLRELMLENDRVIQNAVHNMAASGLPRTALEAEARKLSIKAFKTYDPSKAQLTTHLTHHLQGLNRFVDKHSQAIRLPEAKARQADKVFKSIRELEERLGRKPTNEEISKHTGIGETSLGGLIRYQTQLYSLNEGDETMGQPVREDVTHADVAKDFLYHSLNPQQKIVFQHMTGYNGHPELKPGQITKLLKVSPARVSAIKKEIGKILDDHVNGIDFFTS